MPASDLYSFGATIYYGITGHDVPFFQTRRLNPNALSEYPSGGHTARDFPLYLEQLLSLDPANRNPGSPAWEDYGTIGTCYTGTLAISRDTLLECWNDRLHTRLLTGAEALNAYRKRERWALQLHQLDPEGSAQMLKEAEHWINWLQGEANERE